jgi:hypothetical protein
VLGEGFRRGQRLGEVVFVGRSGVAPRGAFKSLLVPNDMSGTAVSFAAPKIGSGFFANGTVKWGVETGALGLASGRGQNCRRHFLSFLLFGTLQPQQQIRQQRQLAVSRGGWVARAGSRQSRSAGRHQQQARPSNVAGGGRAPAARVPVAAATGLPIAPTTSC